jgi:methyl-accepting chemotaxis protein
MNLNQLKIGPRLALGFGTVLALLALMCAVLYARLEFLAQDTSKVVEMQKRAELATEWRALVQLNASRALAIAKSGGSSELAGYFAPFIKNTSAEITKAQEELTGFIDSAEGKALLAGIAKERTAYTDIRKQVLAHFESGDNARGHELLTSGMVPASEAYIASILKLGQYQDQRVTEAVAGVHSGARSSQALMLALLLAAVGLGSLAAWSISRSITGPLKNTVQATDRIGGGDLTGQIQPEGRDEMAAMQRSLATMQDALRRLVGEVRTGSDSIGTASAQIASGNQDLSSRTEQTSSSLQQAASSLEELTGTVSQTADSARTANQLAASASQAAERGGSVVSQVVSTMDEINSSSRRIADIIGTIDGIAFQTNILALNAAVEAARAGEQGRGFAVVAGEVRSLAQRSAEAAREIKSLIQTSVEKVDAGSRLVQDAGQAMGDIVSGVQRVTDVIGEISAATSEQSAGLRQVNEAVAGLDQMTQQNAALVEESAAAAESMAEQSRKLSEVVAAFRLHGHVQTHSSAPAPRAAAQPAAVAKPKALASQVLAKVKAAPAPRPKAPSAPAAAAPASAPAAPSKAPAGADGDWETF